MSTTESTAELNAHQQIHQLVQREVDQDPWYSENFANTGARFVAWYLRRVLLLDVHETKAAVTDGPNDKQIDAIVVEDAERRVRVIQGKFCAPTLVDAAPLREVLAAWTRLKDLSVLQLECSGKLAERLEAMRSAAFDEDYDVEFELLTTGELSPEATRDFEAFRAEMMDAAEFGAVLTLVNSELLQFRLAEAEQRDLPELSCTIPLEPDKYMLCDESGVRVVLALVPVQKCLQLPGINDGKLFRKNVRQSLGLTNKVNRALRATLVSGDLAPYFFFFHNGITALCRHFELDSEQRLLRVEGLSVVNGCQSLSTIYSTSGKVADAGARQGSVLFRFYEIAQADLADRISINTNSQSAVKARDLRSNDKYMRALKARYETAIHGGYFITKRGEERPADRPAAKCIDSPEYARMVCAWMCQRPNLTSNETRLFDEHYKTLFHTELDPASMLALNRWRGEIEKHWTALSINEAVKAVRGAARFHILFLVSQLFAHASNQADKVPLPSATESAFPYAPLILGQAAQCLNQAVTQANTQSMAAGKIFSPQNWLKGRSAVNDEQLVAGTVMSVLKGIASDDLKPVLQALTLAPDRFSLRWSAE